MHYVYILKSKTDTNKKLYIGCTNDLRKRIVMHNEGKIYSTSKRTPFGLIYYEAYKNKEDAFNREMYLKTGWGRNYIKKALKNYFLQSKNLGG